MKNPRLDVVKSQKRPLSTSLDENSKKIQKLRIKIKDSKLNKTMPASVRMDMKSVRVLVERTKFNVMLNLEHKKLKHNNLPKSSSLRRLDLLKTPLKKLKNKTPLATSTPQPHKQSPQMEAPSKATTTKTAAHHQLSIDGIFKVRKCCIKLPKDKLLLQLQAKQIPYPVELIVHRGRGRPKKASDAAENSLLMVDSPSTGQKRKSSENASSSSPPKRKLKKGNEFFIKIGALTRTPSPKRRPPSISSSPVDNPPSTSQQRRKTAKKLNKKVFASSGLAPLRQKFGSRFFKSFVKIKRFRPNCEPQSTYSPPKTDDPPKKKSGKNLSVSFLETVEIFGESSDDDDWFDMDPKNSTRTAKSMDSLFESLKTSTPCIRSSSSLSNNSNSSGILKSSILDRKEKKSFSPLKETESPRKEQLKLANESFVRRSLETQIADDEEREIAEDLTEAESAERSSTVPESGTVNDIEHNSSDCSSASHDASSKLKTPRDDKEDKEDDKEDKEEQLNSSNNSTDETSSMHAHKSNEDTEDEATPTKSNQENEESFKSANASINENDAATQENTPNSPNIVKNEQEQNLEDKDDKSDDIPAAEEENLDDNKADEEPADHQEEEEADQEDKANEDEILKEDVCPGDDDHAEEDEEAPFVDPSKLVASVLLNDSTEEELNEAEAVLNDVCQIAAAESAVLLNPAEHLAYSSPHSALDDDDDDFNSVLTHPETEKTLQSTAASALVPNSQEIAVEAAVASQATMVAPADVDVTEDTFASVVAEVERFTKDVVNSEIYSADVGITGADVMMENVQARHSLDDIFDDDVDDDIMSSLRISSGSIDIGHDKSLPIQVIETEVMAIPNEPDLIFDKPLGTTDASSITNGPQFNSTNDTLPGLGEPAPAPESNKKLFGRLFQSVKSYVMSPAGEKNNASLQD